MNLRKRLAYRRLAVSHPDWRWNRDEQPEKRSIVAGLAAAATAAIVIGSALPASAASLYVGGDVNCGATWVNYTNERKTTAWGPTDLYLSNAAGSTYGGWGTTVGVKITAAGALHSANYANGADA